MIHCLVRFGEFVKLTLVVVWGYIVALFRLLQTTSPKSLKNQVILVTGGSNGIGREILLRVAQVERDLTLISWDIDEAANQALIKELKSLGVTKVLAYTVDVTDYDQVIQTAAKVHRSYSFKEFFKERMTFEEFQKVREDAGDVTMLFNNAGICAPVGRCWETNLNHAKKLVDVNLVSHWYIIREFLPAMIRNGRGHIIATCSVAGFLWVPYFGPYVASKHAVKGYYECLKEDLRTLEPKCDITISMVYPSWIATNLVSSLRLQDTALIPSPLSPSKLAETIVRGVCRNQEHIYFPRNMRLNHMFINWCPPEVSRRLVDSIEFDPLGVRSKEKELSQVTCVA